MKTCEEYVLKRLEELEKQNDKLRKEKEELLIKLNDAKNDQKLLIAIGDRIKIKEGDDDFYRVYFDNDFVTLYNPNNKEKYGIFETLENRAKELINDQE